MLVYFFCIKLTLRIKRDIFYVAFIVVCSNSQKGGKLKKIFSLTFIMLMVTAALAVPNLFNYQGKLTNVSGVGVNDSLDMIVRIYDDSTAGTMVDRDTIMNVPVVKGLFDLQYEVELTITDLDDNLYLELEIEGGYVMSPRVVIAAVPYALAALYVDSAHYAIKADSLGNYVATDLLPNDLQGAYDLDENIITDASGPVDIRTATDGRAVELRTNDDIEPALYVFNDGAGPAIFCSGDLRMNGDIWSNDDIKIQLDKNVSASDEEFRVKNDTGVVVFSVDEHGDAMILGELDPKAVTFQPQPAAPAGVEGKVYYDDAAGNLKWHDGTDWQDFGSGSGGSYVENQNAAAQDADFWIDGQGIVGGTATVGEGSIITNTSTSSGTWVPLAGWYHYARNVSVVHAPEIGATGPMNLDKLGIYLVTPSSTDPWTYDSLKIWFVQVTTDTVPETWDVSRATLVYSSDAEVVPQVAGWYEFDVTDFAYDGTSNLLILFQHGYQSTSYGSGGPSWGYTTQTVNNYCRRGYSDSAWMTALASTTSRPDFRMTFSDMPIIVDRVTIEDGDVTADNDVAAGSFTLDYTITSWPVSITRLDTITATDHDTVVVDEALKVMGELIADSIQAVGPVIYLDDNIEVDGDITAGCATFGGGAIPMDTVFFEDFESGGISAWTIVDSSASGFVWDDINPGGITPNAASGITGTFPIIDSDNAGSGTNVWASLASPVIDLSSYTTVYLSFGNHFDWLSGTDYGNLYVWNGSAWILLHTYQADTYSKEVFDISPYINAAFQVMFVYNDNSAWAWYWMIDNVLVSAPLGAAPAVVNICTGDIDADGDIDGGTFTLNSVTITDWPTGGVVDFDTINATRHDTVVVDEALKVMGELIADSIQAAGDVIEMDDNVRVAGDLVATDSVIATNVYASNNVNANTSMTLNGVSITAWPGGGVTSSLDGAYDYLTPGGGRVILADAGPVFIDATMGDTAISAINASPIDPTAFFQNLGGGPAIETVGDVTVHGGIYSDLFVATPLIFNPFGDTVWVDSKLYANEFVADTIEAREDYTFFRDAIWIEDSIWMDGSWHTTWGGGGVANIDTLWMASGLTTDTMVAMAQFKVFGELIADSIQAVGGIIYLDDSVYIDGNIEIEDSIVFDYRAHIWYGDGSEGFGMYYSPDPSSSSEEHNFMIDEELAVQIYDHGLMTTFIEAETLYSASVGTLVVDDDLMVMGELIADSIQAQADIIYLDDNIEVDGCALFKGTAGIGTILFDEGFETSVPPTGWTANILTGSTNWAQEGTDYHAGSYSASFITTSSGNSAELYTASMDITSLTTPTLSFWHTQELWSSDQDSLQVYYRDAAAGSWILLASYTINIATWTMESILLPSSSADYWIRFVAYGEYGYGVLLDDVMIFEPGTPAGDVNICDGDITTDGDLTVAGDATVDGKLTVHGLIDPTGLVLDPQAANPIASGDKGIYVGTDDKLYYYDGTTTADISGGGSGSGSLQSAYDGGNAIVTTGGNAVSITAATGDALYLNSTSGNGVQNDAGYWSPTGNVSLGTGNFHTNSGIYQSNADFVAKIDADADGTNEFKVLNDTDGTVFSVDENGNAIILGYLDVSNITNSGGDSIWIDKKVWVDELVTDSIESRGNTIWIRDSIIVNGSGLFVGNTNDTLLIVSNFVGTGDVVGEYIEVDNASADAADEAVGLVVDVVANGSIGTGIKSFAETFHDDAWGGYFSGAHHGAANAGGVQATAFNDASGDAIGTLSKGTIAPSNTVGSAYGVESRGTVFGAASTGDAYGGYFDAQNSGTGIEYGIYAKTTTVPGNWAGFFKGNVAVSDTFDAYGGIVLGGVYRNTWPSGGGAVDFDTINATRHDTVVVSEALKVMGELIADSIQAVGSVIEMDDDVNVIGAVSLGGDSTFRNDWEPQDVITVGAANADFVLLDDAIAAITAGTNTLIDIAPGNYVVTGAPTLGSGIHVRGSGPNNTLINGPLTIEGYAFHLTFYGGMATFNDATVSECNFEDNVVATGASFGYCNFRGDPIASSISITDHAIFHDCQIEVPVITSGVCKLSTNVIMNMVTIGGMGGIGEFTGNIFMGGAITVREADIYAEANLFTKDMEGMEVGPAIYILTGSAEIKANHFVGRTLGAVSAFGGSVNMLSNDIINCGNEAEGAIAGMGAIVEVNLLGNHIDGKSGVISPGINIVGGMDGVSGSIKDNIIEGHSVGVILSGMNVEIQAMPIDNNIIRNNQNDGLMVGGGSGNYLIVHNTLYNNNLSGGMGVDLSNLGCALVVSHNVVDTYSSAFSPVPGALNTTSSGIIWVGAPQVGQLP